MDQVAQITSTFGVRWDLLATQVISFTIVCAILYKFAHKPILRMLDARRQQIAQGLANAAEINSRLEGIESQRQSILAEARLEAGRIVDRARFTAKRLEEEQKRLAAAAAEQIVHKAREAAVHERARMQADLKGEVGRLVVQTSAAVIGSVLTAADQRRLAEETARQLSRAAASGTGAA